MKKNIGKTLSLFLLPALCVTAAAVSFADLSVTGAIAETATNAFENGLLAPQTYKEYLPLTKPADVAMTERYTAIADGNGIFVYDKNDELYEKYEHAANVDASKNEVTKVQFDDAGNLYFLDASAYLYVLDPEKTDEGEWTVERTSFTCSNFLIHGNELYFTTPSGTTTQLSVTSLSEPDVTSAASLLSNLLSKPAIAFFGGDLYYTDSGKMLCKIDPTQAADGDKPTPTQIAMFSSEIVSMTLSGGVFACSDVNGGFYAYDLPALAEAASASKIDPILSDEDSYAAISSYGDHIYAVNGDIVRQYEVPLQDFTDFEICDSSPARKRLSGAVETVLVKNRLFIANNGAGRVSVYNTAKKDFEEPVNATLPPSFLASSGEEILLANAESAAIYSLGANNYGEEIATFDGFNGAIKGAAEVYGNYYLVTENNYFYALSENADGAWGLRETKRISTRYPKLLASDAYGYLYVACGNGVYRFTETEFSDPLQAGTELCDSLPTNASRLAVDYEGDLYALSDNLLYKFTAPTEAGGLYARTEIDAHTSYVYGSEGYTPQITAFAFGIEENIAYLLCDGNYLVQTDVFALPTVKNIAVNGADESIFADTGAEFSVVNTAQGALLVEFDLGALQGAENFPYLSYRRLDNAESALKIGEAGKYELIALLDKGTKGYSTYLVLKDSCTALDGGDYRVVYPENERKAGYIVNALPLYKFPYLCDLLTAAEELPRTAQVTLLGEIGELDYEYYHVSWVDENGEVKTGYVPKAYVSPIEGAPPASEEYLSGEAESDKDVVWRLAYILLGFAVICILVDYLLLKKKNDS